MVSLAPTWSVDKAVFQPKKRGEVRSARNTSNLSLRRLSITGRYSMSLGASKLILIEYRSDLETKLNNRNRIAQSKGYVTPFLPPQTSHTQ